MWEAETGPVHFRPEVISPVPSPEELRVVLPPNFFAGDRRRCQLPVLIRGPVNGPASPIALDQGPEIGPALRIESATAQALRTDRILPTGISPRIAPAESKIGKSGKTPAGNAATKSVTSVPTIIPGPISGKITPAGRHGESRLLGAGPLGPGSPDGVATEANPWNMPTAKTCITRMIRCTTEISL
jgi:hypothetical protein